MILKGWQYGAVVLVYRVILKPSHTPAIAPIALNNREDIEKDDTPQSVGIYPPIIPPTNIKIQIIFFVLITISI